MGSSPIGIHLLGPAVLSAFLTMGLYGAGMLQGWIYWRKHRNEDRWQIPSLVLFVLFCDTVQQAMLCHAVYLYVVDDYSKGVPIMTSYHGTVTSHSFPGSILVFAIRSFYCWRIRKLISSQVVAGSIFLVTLATMVVLLVYIALALQLSSLSELASLTTLLTVCIILSVISDVSIPLGMIWGLRQRKGEIGSRSNDLVSRLIIFTFHTTTPTALCAILDLILIYALPGTMYFGMFYVLTDRFYTNCLLVTLNSRKYLRDGLKNGPLNPVRHHQDIVLSGSLFPTGTVQFAVNPKAGEFHAQRDSRTEGQTTDTSGTQDAYGSRDFHPSIV